VTVIVVGSLAYVLQCRHQMAGNAGSGFLPPRSDACVPSFGSGLVISWSGMRGHRHACGRAGVARGVSVSRHESYWTAFFVVLGTSFALPWRLTLGPLLRALVDSARR
jgi:hypothetical protein